MDIVQNAPYDLLLNGCRVIDPDTVILPKPPLAAA